MASVAVFVALGGVGYAAATLNGGSIINHTIGGGKLKNGTLTSTQVKKNSLTGSVINESSLSTVPAAQTAATATTAGNAATAGSATTATSAATANHATTADQATTAGSAERASMAADAETLGGLSSTQLQVTCPADTELFGGMCWDVNVRPASGWIAASVKCGEAGGRLPSLSELIAYVLQPGEQVAADNWSGDVVDFTSGEPFILARGEASTESSAATSSHGYRCLFYRVN
jgi:hypothetical protein